jgi:hypothetical protein
MISSFVPIELPEHSQCRLTQADAAIIGRNGAIGPNA